MNTLSQPHRATHLLLQHKLAAASVAAAVTSCCPSPVQGYVVHVAQQHCPALAEAQLYLQQAVLLCCINRVRTRLVLLVVPIGCNVRCPVPCLAFHTLHQHGAAVLLAVLHFHLGKMGLHSIG